MQVQDVKVTTGADGFSSVRFIGQGGESIDVRLAGSASGGDPVARARAVMTQVASFEPAVEGETGLSAGAVPATAEGEADASDEPTSGPAGDVWNRPGARAPLPDREG